MLDDDQITDEQIESIMGQYVFAAGAGARGQWVQRPAIFYLRKHYLPSIEVALREGEDWTKDAPKILHYLNVIGGLAAQKATADGRDAISESDMSEAVLTVENHYREMVRLEGDQDEPLGKWCGS